MPPPELLKLTPPSPAHPWLQPGRLMLCTAIACAILLPLDGLLSHAARDFGEQLPSDFRRTLETLQQWGDFASLVLTTFIIFRLDVPRRRRLGDLWLSLGLALLACVILMLLVGRPRPEAAEAPWTFILPWQTFSFSDHPPVHAWDLIHAGHSKLWSMPSRHTLAAMVLSVFLTALYPRLKPLAVVMVCLTALARIILGAHYPTDTLLGALLGYLIAFPVVQSQWASRRWFVAA